MALTPELWTFRVESSTKFRKSGSPVAEEIQQYRFSIAKNELVSATRTDAPGPRMRSEARQSASDHAEYDAWLRATGKEPRPKPPKVRDPLKPKGANEGRTADRTSGSQYDRTAALSYALSWWAGRNPSYPIASDDDTDCTNFASQILRAGGWENYAPDLYDDVYPNPFYYKEPDVWYHVAGWVPQPNSWTWSAANNLSNFPLYHDDRGSYEAEGWATPGDLIFFDWNGDDVVDHVMVVSTVDDEGNELLTGHTNERWDYPLAWAMEDAFEEHGQYPGIWRLSPDS